MSICFMNYKPQYKIIQVSKINHFFTSFIYNQINDSFQSFLVSLALIRAVELICARVEVERKNNFSSKSKKEQNFGAISQIYFFCRKWAKKPP